MNTECPYCKTEFRITRQQLELADGMVRCGLCHKTFNALAQNKVDSDREPGDEKAAALSNNVELPELEELYRNELLDGDTAQLIPDEFRAPEQPVSHEVWTGLVWSVAILLLAFSLVIEYAWFNRNTLVTIPELKPWITRLCDAADCELISVRNPEKIKMVSRNVYSHPNVDSALMVSVTMINNADYAQPWPDMQIDFSDVRGEVIAGRRFTPEEYTGLAQEKIAPLQPDKPVTIALEIKDPGPQAMTYQFGFH